MTAEIYLLMLGADFSPLAHIELASGKLPHDTRTTGHGVYALKQALRWCRLTPDFLVVLTLKRGNVIVEAYKVGRRSLGRVLE